MRWAVRKRGYKSNEGVAWKLDTGALWNLNLFLAYFLYDLTRR